jgi:hypothetical protein
MDSSGHVVLTPPKDWNGLEVLRFCATDRKGASAVAGRIVDPRGPNNACPEGEGLEVRE